MNVPPHNSLYWQSAKNDLPHTRSQRHRTTTSLCESACVLKIPKTRIVLYRQRKTKIERDIPKGSQHILHRTPTQMSVTSQHSTTAEFLKAWPLCKLNVSWGSPHTLCYITISSFGATSLLHLCVFDETVVASVSQLFSTKAFTNFKHYHFLRLYCFLGYWHPGFLS